MQIFPKARLQPQCYCTWWPQFSLARFGGTLVG